MIAQAESAHAETQCEICGYPVERVIATDQCYIAGGPGGRRVVLKRMDEDCLLQGGLHPTIKDRLCRVRELAHGGVANLHGVGREGDAAYMIWEYVPGITFDEYVAAPQRTNRELLLLARELVLSVDSLHLQGIVHGALIGGNIIVQRDGSIRLTHVSPLLYTDTETDVECVIGLLEDAVEQSGRAKSPLGNLLTEIKSQDHSLKTLAGKIAGLLNARTDVSQPQLREKERGIRRRSLLAAGLVAVVGGLIGYGIWHAVDRGPTLPSLMVDPATRLEK
jgi:hypothetical protein